MLHSDRRHVLMRSWSRIATSAGQAGERDPARRMVYCFGKNIRAVTTRMYGTKEPNETII
jgi:hypothetical protein